MNTTGDPNDQNRDEAIIRELLLLADRQQVEPPVELVERVRARLRERKAGLLEVSNRIQAERTRPAFSSPSLTTLRRVMRSPVSRVAAAAVFVAAISGLVLWFHGSGATPAMADFLQPILSAKTVKYKMIMDLPPALCAEFKTSVKTSTTYFMVLDAYRTREEMVLPNNSRTIQIQDSSQGKAISLDPEHKWASVHSFGKTPKVKPSDNNPVATFRGFLISARKMPRDKCESLGERQIDGRRAVGFRFRGPTGVLDVWGDPKTSLPIRIEITTAPPFNMKSTMTDFEFNVPMDASLFSVEPPPGYKVSEVSTCGQPVEKDLIDLFRTYGESTGGPLPDTLEHKAIWWWLNMVMLQAEHPSDGSKPTKEQEQKIEKINVRLQTDMRFTMMLPKEAQPHYAGKGVSLGAPGRPIFWYRPTAGGKYRVIYADLSIRESQTPPNVPVSQPELKDLINALRWYGQKSDGPLPDKLEDVLFMTMVMIKAPSPKSGKPSAKQKQETARTLMKLYLGVTFAESLPPEADAHYAGRGVKLGAADKPIFWYRPKDAKKYQVVYADLSVRELQTPPLAPVILPEQDLIDTLRYYAELSGGLLPPTAEMDSFTAVVAAKFPDVKGEEPNQKQTQEIVRITMKLLPGPMFIQALLPKADAHYAGRGVKLGAADKPIFWYRPADAKKYRVIYGDLAVREAETPPVAPVELPEEGLIDLLRYYGELNGGVFLEKWNDDSVSPLLEKKFCPKKGQPRTAKQIEELVKFQTKCAPARGFMKHLSPKADAHYAGRGVKLGAADKPIFWYRPTDTKKYRVIYGDLSVRDSDTAPKAPDAQSLPSVSGSRK